MSQNITVLKYFKNFAYYITAIIGTYNGMIYKGGCKNKETVDMSIHPRYFVQIGYCYSLQDVHPIA